VYVAFDADAPRSGPSATTGDLPEGTPSSTMCAGRILGRIGCGSVDPRAPETENVLLEDAGMRVRRPTLPAVAGA